MRRLAILLAGAALLAGCAAPAVPEAASAVQAVSSPSTGSAFGPTIRLPWTVGATRTPLPFSLGHWKMTCCTRVPSDLSRR